MPGRAGSTSNLVALGAVPPQLSYGRHSPEDSLESSRRIRAEAAVGFAGVVSEMDKLVLFRKVGRSRERSSSRRYGRWE